MEAIFVVTLLVYSIGFNLVSAEVKLVPEEREREMNALFQELCKQGTETITPGSFIECNRLSVGGTFGNEVYNGARQEGGMKKDEFRRIYAKYTAE